MTGMRLFVAIPASDAAPTLAPFLEECASRAPFIRWLDARVLHLTLRFLGEIPEERLPEVEAWFLAAAASPAPPLRAEATGLFRRKERVVLFLKVVPDPALASYARRFLSPVAGCEPESRTFLPHVTLARHALAPGESGRFRAFLEWFGTVRLPEIRLGAPRAVLYRSMLTPSGAVHAPLREAPPAT